MIRPDDAATSQSAPHEPPVQMQIESERHELLEQLEDALEGPMWVLGLVWLGLLVAELIWGLNGTLEWVGTAIWIVFLVDFTVKFLLAPHKIVYLRTNWITALALLLPALRILRIARLARLLSATRTVRGLRLFRLLSSLNRGFRALNATLGRRGFGYVVLLTVIVSLAGAAGMYAFERESSGFGTYGEAVWWTAMMMTTSGSEAWPQTSEGRLLCFLLALYAFTVFGYVTASLATFFIGRDAHNEEAELPNAESIEALRQEIAALREEIRLGSGHASGNLVSE